MLTSLLTYLARIARRLIVRVTLYAAFAMLSVLAAMLIGPFLPEAWISYMGTGALETVLGTLASSLLAVTTFSLTILASTFRAVEASATPRAVLILREDQTTQRILSVFIGAFLFSLTCIILMATPLMSPATRFVLFLVTVLMVLQVVVAIIRWIHHIELLGSIENLLDCLQNMAVPVLRAHWRAPSHGANPLGTDDLERGNAEQELYAQRNGYVTMIALEALQEEAAACQGRIFVHVKPGDYVAEGDLLMRLDFLSEPSDMTRSILKNSVLISSSRSFDQDPEFCVIVMTEIANRALSSGINDPQTAVDVVHRLGAVLRQGAGQAQEEAKLCYDRLWVKPLDSARLFTSSYDVIAREGGDVPEVAEALTQSLERLSARDAMPLQGLASECLQRLDLPN